MSDFDHSKIASFILPDGSLYSVRVNTSKTTEKGGNGFQNLEQDLITLDDLESKLSKPPEEESSEINSGNIEGSHQSAQAQAPRTLDPDQITHGFVPISRKLFDNLSQPSLNHASPNTSSSLA